MPKTTAFKTTLGMLTLLAAAPAWAQAPAAAPAAAAHVTTIGTLNPVAVVFFVLWLAQRRRRS